MLCAMCTKRNVCCFVLVVSVVFPVHPIPLLPFIDVVASPIHNGGVCQVVSPFTLIAVTDRLVDGIRRHECGWTVQSRKYVELGPLFCPLSITWIGL